MLCKNVNGKLFSNCHVKPWNYKTLIIVPWSNKNNLFILLSTSQGENKTRFF